MHCECRKFLTHKQLQLHLYTELSRTGKSAHTQLVRKILFVVYFHKFDIFHFVAEQQWNEKMACRGRRPPATCCFLLYFVYSLLQNESVCVCVYLAFGTPTICFSHDMSSSLNSRRGLTVFRRKLDFRSLVAVFFAEAHIGNEVTFSFRSAIFSLFLFIFRSFVADLFLATFLAWCDYQLLLSFFGRSRTFSVYHLLLHSSRVWRKQFFSFQRTVRRRRIKKIQEK